MSTETLFLLLIVVLILGILPAWPYSKAWGYTPPGILTLLLVVFLVWAVAGNRPLFRTAGQDLKAAGRDVAESIRHTVQ